MGEGEGDLGREQEIKTAKAVTWHKEPSATPFSPSNPKKVEVSTGRLPSWQNPDKNLRRFHEISPAHGRSMTESASSKKVIWGGERKGDIYGARNLKGTYMPGDPLINQSYDLPGGIYIHGLMDGASIKRQRNASWFMRGNGLPTEFPREIKELKEVWRKDKKAFKFKKLPIERWKKQELNKLTERIREYEKENSPDSEDHYYLNQLELLRNLKDYFDFARFYSVERDIQVDERLEDLGRAAEQNRLEEMTIPIIKWLKVASKEKKELFYDHERLNKIKEDKEGVAHYLEKWLPAQMGFYLARFHKLELAHHYLHGQNWSAVGTIYDLDSVVGPALGDQPNSNKDYTKDLGWTVKVLGALATDVANFKDQGRVDLDQNKRNVCLMFLTTYVKKRFPAGERAAGVENLKKALSDQTRRFEPEMQSLYDFLDLVKNSRDLERI